MTGRAAAHSAGFTLLELLVVLFIIGITLAFATLTFDSGNEARRLKHEAERLEALMGIASEDAVLFGLELGLDLTREGYRFLRLDSDGWQPIGASDSPLRPRELPEGMELRLLAAEDERENLDRLAPRGEDDTEEDEDDDGGPRPEVLFLSSGEMMPFELELFAQDAEPRYLFETQRQGEVAMRRETPAGS